MAVIYANTTASFSANPFTKVAASALDINCANGARTALNTERLITFTPNEAANCTEALLALAIGSNTAGQSVTVQLQKNIASVWTNMGTKTINYDDIIGTHKATMSTSGMAIVAFVWDEGAQALTTDASTWRLRVISTNASAYLCNHRTSGYCYAVPTVTAATYSSGDSVVIKQDVVLTVDQTVTLTDIWAGVNSSFGNTNPAGSYTWTATGYYYRSNNSVFNAGASATPVSFANKLTLAFTNQWATPFIWNGDCQYEDYIYGAYTTTFHSKIASDASNGQKNIVLTDDRSANWQAGDTIWIWGANSIETKIIDTMSGTTCTVTVNLSQTHCDGWTVLNLTRVQNEFGIVSSGKIGGPGGASGTTGAGAYPRKAEYSGIYDTNATGITINGYDNTGTTLGTDTKNLLAEYIVFNSAGSFTTAIPTQARTAYANLQNYRYMWKNNSSGACYSIGCSDAVISNLYAGTYVNPITIGGTNVGNNLTVSYIQVCTTWNGAYGGINITAVKSDFSYLKIGTVGQGLKLGACFNNTFTSCTSDAQGTGGVYYNTTSTGNRFINCDFGSESTNTSDIYLATGVLVQDIYRNCLFGATPVNTTQMGAATDGSYLKLDTFDQTANSHRAYFTYGNTVSTGDGLTDTTVHTTGTGKFAIRFEPQSSTDNFEWSFVIPTGDIQTKTMSIAVWCKINSATYYANTHQLPRLTIDFDNGTEGYCQAAEITDWQLMSVTFIPTTTYGQVTVTLSGRTDATTTDAYIYWDDFNIAYPANTSLDLGGLDNWANALPVTPPLAIPLSANTVALSVWQQLTATGYGTGSMGEFMKALPTASAPSVDSIADAVWDETASDHVTTGSTGKTLGTGGKQIKLIDDGEIPIYES